MNLKRVEVDVFEEIQKDLDSGFTKSDLERLIGLPMNTLSAIMNKKIPLSKLSHLKIIKWSQSEKPNPLTLFRPTNKPKPKKKKTIPKELDRQEVINWLAKNKKSN